MNTFTTGRTKSGVIALLASMALILALAAPAFSQSTLNGYRDQGGKAQGQVQGTEEGNGSSPDNGSAGNGDNSGNAGNAQRTVGKGSGTLPFTGMELGLVLAMGAALLGVGVGLRRVSRPPAS